MTDDRTLPKNYESAQVEPAVYELWLEAGSFRALPDERPRDRRYVIMMPLPNVTGALHMGHAMDNVMQDLLIRWHRMMGDNALWQPGTDHAGIATQAVVEKRLKELEGKTRHDIGREGLIERIWAWKDQYQARIVSQQQRMGCSCDWTRQRFTMDDVCARAVRHTFFRLFKDGLVGRGKRLVNWDVFLQTSVSDDEVYHETVPGHFWHLKYPVIDPQPGEPAHVVVATTRPETMLGDTAVAVHPDPAGALDARIEKAREALARAPGKDKPAIAAQIAAFEERRTTMLASLVQLRDMAKDGRHVLLPLMDRRIPLLLDEWAKPELGSGCVKITPAHDPNDYDVWTRHRDRIDILNVLSPDGTINENAGPYAGLERFAARDKVVADLDALGLLGPVEDRDVEIGHSDRSKTPIEPFLSDQWYVRMGDVTGGVLMGRGTEREHTSPGLVQAAMDAVTDGRVRFHPERYTKTYLDWLAEKRDWPISRQLWWGHRIPVWAKRAAWRDVDLTELAQALGAGSDRAFARVHFLDDGRTAVVAGDGSLSGESPRPDESVAIDVCLLEDDEALVGALEALGYERDADVLDTWFSSALWPFSTLGWPDPATAAIGAGQTPLAALDGAPDSLDFYYPGSCLVTGRDIITLWVARMVLAGLYCIGDIPFSDVFIHANILDGKGERMSKSKGNGIDPVDIIAQYGTDAMRYVLADMQTGSQDIRLPVTAVCPRCDHHNDLGDAKHGKSIFIRICGKCKAEFDILGTIPDLPRGTLISERFDIGRSFCTKLWNSARFALMNLDVPDDPAAPPVARDELAIEDRWILDGLAESVRAVTQGLADYNPSEAIGAAREFFWASLCDWYLELIKPRLAEPTSRTAFVARRVLAHALDQVLRLLHPFVPFITEHLWQKLNEIAPDRSLGALAPAPRAERIIGAAWPRPNESMVDPDLRESFMALQDVTRAIREVRSSVGMAPRAPLTVTVKPTPERRAALEAYFHVVQHLAGVETVHFDEAATRKPGQAAKVARDLELFIHDVIDDAEERGRLEKQKAKLVKEIEGVEKRLANPNFVERAPAEVVRDLGERLEGFRSSLEALERSLSLLV